MYKLSFLFIPLILLSSCTSEGPKDNSLISKPPITTNHSGTISYSGSQNYYYKLASSYCPEDGPGGCMESIDIMRHHGYKLAEGGICPIGLKVDGHTVPTGLTWCAPSDAYYTDLRKSCNGDTCCLSSVDAIEQGKYLETKDGTCITELAPNMQRCLTSKQWCQHSFLVKDFGSGFTLEQTKERTLLYYYGKFIRDWSHTPARVYPFIENEGCQELFEASMQKNPSPPGLGGPLFYRKYIWNLFTPEEQKACMKVFYGESIRVVPYDARFVSILWSNYQSYNITLYDILSGYSHDLLDHGDTIKKVDFENNSIIVTTNYDKKKSVDATQYKTAFPLSFTGVLWTTVTD